MILCERNERFLMESVERVSLVLTDPPWGAGVQNADTPYRYEDPMDEMGGHVERLLRYTERCADIVAIFCDKRALYLWHYGLRAQLSEDRIQHVILESALGNYRHDAWPQKHYYMIIGSYRPYFDYRHLPDTDRRAPKRGADSEKRKVNSVVQATISCTDGERVPGFQAQKPVWFLRKVIEVLSPSGGCVVDPYMGTGSTGVAAYQVGRKFLGIEQNAETYRVAERRISDAERVLTLF